MKIRIINPDYGVGEEAMARRCTFLQRYVGPDVELSMVCLTQTRVEIDSASDVVLAGPEILHLAHQAEQEGCQAVVLYCFSDPVLEACREQLTIPVVGGAQASMLLFPALARNVSVILADPARIGEKEAFLGTLGVDRHHIGRITAIDFRGKSIWDNREEAYGQLVAAGRELKEQGAECVALGCLSFLGLAEPLSRELGIPVIDPAIGAVSLAESLVRQGLATSKVAYPKPFSTAF
ncbi:aspartate/glutamate racemase family protein [Acidaminococcus timonensis]|uniref:aspartate/glutamate racemase family protein n=1 Tax=Acidaminococcus timonensis TaxID=1871002 RepID=UPI0030789265